MTDQSIPNDLFPVDSEVFRLPNGGTVIGRDAYEAELVRSVFRSGATALSDTLPADVDADAFNAYVTGVVGSLGYFDSVDAAVSEFRDAYVGAFTLIEYAHQCADDFIGADAGMARDYFDAERFARDLAASGAYSEVNGYVFSHG